MGVITTGSTPKALQGSERMAKLTTKARKKIPTSEFAGPDRSYPVQDRSHAANALSRVSQFGSPALKAKVRAKVRRKYPGMGGKAHEAGKHAHHPPTRG